MSLQKTRSKIKAYFFHPNSDCFFIDDFDSKFSPIEEVEKIGLAIRPSINDLMSKLIKRYDNDSYIVKEAMHIVEIDNEGNFIDERDEDYEPQIFEYHSKSKPKK